MTPYLDDGDVRLYAGDALAVLRELPSGSVDCIVTSPPYYGLRNYGVAGQIGLEPTPEEYVAALVAVFREVRRVLKPEATLWLNLGDAYSDKQLLGLPWRVAFALQADGWWLRSDIIFAKPNPMPESVTDRPTSAHEHVFLLAKQPRYWFDQEAVREPDAGLVSGNGFAGRQGGARQTAVDGGTGSADRFTPGAGRNARTVWEIATEPTPMAHFATFPQALVERCLAAGCPPEVCRTCGEARRRVVDGAAYAPAIVCVGERFVDESRGDKLRKLNGKSGEWRAAAASRKTTGWTDCGHGDYRPGVVLDPFIGSGTTALVARRMGRRAVGIELSEEYLAIAAKRLRQLSLFAEATVEGDDGAA